MLQKKKILFLKLKDSKIVSQTPLNDHTNQMIERRYGGRVFFFSFFLYEERGKRRGEELLFPCNENKKIMLPHSLLIPMLSLKKKF